MWDFTSETMIDLSRFSLYRKHQFHHMRQAEFRRFGAFKKMAEETLYVSALKGTRQKDAPAMVAIQ